jgi:glucokinase
MCAAGPSPVPTTGAVVAAVDIGGTKIDVALAAEGGRLYGPMRLETRAAEGAAAAVGRVAAAVEELRRRHAPHTHVSAAGVVCPGVVHDDRILLAPNLPGWEEADLAGLLRAALGVRSVELTNDVRAGALAEARSGALRRCRSGLYVNLGTGLAAALVVDGQVLDGAHSAAGEIGYIQPLGALGAWPAGGHAHLEAAVSGAALANRAANVLGVDVEPAQLFGRTDPVSTHVVHQALGALGTALVNLAVFADPDRVVLGGGLTASADVVVPVLEAYLRAGVPFPPEVLLGSFPHGASLHGAAALALEALSARAGALR